MGYSLVSGTLIFPCAKGGCTHRGMYPGWPDEGRDKQRGQAEQKAQRALHVSGHDEEDRGGQPVVAWINILLRGWKERLKKPKDGLEVIKDYGSYQLLQKLFFLCKEPWKKDQKNNKKTCPDGITWIHKVKILSTNN